MEYPNSAIGDARWPKIVRDATRKLGFASITELLVSRQAIPYAKLCEEIEGTSPIQLIRLAFEEASSSDELRTVSVDCLCRNIVEKCCNGWGSPSNPNPRQMLATSTWVSEVSGTGDNASLRPMLMEMARDLLSQQIPDDWLPQSNSDPVLTSLFDRHWQS